MCVGMTGPASQVLATIRTSIWAGKHVIVSITTKGFIKTGWTIEYLPGNDQANYPLALALVVLAGLGQTIVDCVWYAYQPSEPIQPYSPGECK